GPGIPRRRRRIPPRRLPPPGEARPRRRLERARTGDAPHGDRLARTGAHRLARAGLRGALRPCRRRGRPPQHPGARAGAALDGVRVGEDALLHLREPAEQDPRGPAVPAWFQLTSAAAYTGCAHAARDEVARFCRERRPNAMAEPISALPTVRLRLGRIDGAV